MNKQGLSRLANMVKIVEDIGKTGNIRERIPIQGDDEMTLLAERINSMLGVLQELYEKEAQLRHSLETEMNRRIDFTRALVHELKTPLTPLLTSSDILVSEISTEPYASLAKNINRGALRLENRINELLDLAKGEIGTLVLTPLIIQPSELLKSIIDEMKPVVASQGLSLNLDIPASLPSFQGDEERLRQVLLNLLNNACRFSPEGGIITIKVTERDNSLSVEVLDRGPGIREEELEKVFLPYYRSDYENKRYSGLGIGLALSKMLIELHKGKIWARNREGGGSIFGFSVPLDTTE
jgi:signal transduction histidine kinase